jgi:hypothetical protein
VDRSTKCTNKWKIIDCVPTVDRRAIENPQTLTSGKQTVLSGGTLHISVHKMGQLMDRNVQNATRKDILQGFVKQEGETRR